MSDDNPPRACLADFGSMTIVLDPDHPMSCSAQLEGGTTMFMPPELLVPSKFGFNDSVPTPQADVYAFGLVIYQVCDQDRSYLSFTYTTQVLTGEIPWRGLRIAELAFKVVEGVRPAKPENASKIGFSDLLWDFVGRCWDGIMELRPKIGEVVAELERAAADWNRVMPPCVQAENVASVSKEPMSGSMEHCEFAIPILTPYRSLNGTGGIFGESSSTVPESLTESQIISSLFEPLNTPSTQCTELPSEVQEAVIKLPNEPQPEPRAPTPPRKDPRDDFPMYCYPHLGQCHQPPPTRIPPKKRKGFVYLKQKFREFFRRSTPDQPHRYNYAYPPSDQMAADELDKGGPFALLPFPRLKPDHRIWNSPQCRTRNGGKRLTNCLRSVAEQACYPRPCGFAVCPKDQRNLNVSGVLPAFSSICTMGLEWPLRSLTPTPRAIPITYFA